MARYRKGQKLQITLNADVSQVGGNASGDRTWVHLDGTTRGVQHALEDHPDWRVKVIEPDWKPDDIVETPSGVWHIRTSEGTWRVLCTGEEITDAQISKPLKLLKLVPDTSREAR